MTALGEESEATGESRLVLRYGWSTGGKHVLFTEVGGPVRGSAGSNTSELDFGQTQLKMPMRNGDVNEGSMFAAIFYRPGSE